MIPTRDVILANGVANDLSDGLRITGTTDERRRSVDLTITAGGTTLLLRPCLDLWFDFERERFAPHIEIVEWNGLIVLMGKSSWIPVFLPRKQIRYVFELNRRKEDDSGFYHVVCRQEENVLVAIYEGGVVGFSEEGDVLWNREKSWDEVFVKSENGVLHFESEFSEGFRIDANTGRMHCRPAG